MKRCECDSEHFEDNVIYTTDPEFLLLCRICGGWLIRKLSKEEE